MRRFLTLGWLLLAVAWPGPWAVAGTPGIPAFVSPNTPPLIRVRVVAPSALDVNAPGATIDGVTMNAGDRVLKADPTPDATNGPWVWNGAATAMTRPDDRDASNEYFPSMTVIIGEGTTYRGSLWVFRNTAQPTLGSTALDFARVTDALHNDTATEDPPDGECRVGGYNLGSRWTNTTLPRTWDCLPVGESEAEWLPRTIPNILPDRRFEGAVSPQTAVEIEGNGSTCLLWFSGTSPVTNCTDPAGNRLNQSTLLGSGLYRSYLGADGSERLHIPETGHVRGEGMAGTLCALLPDQAAASDNQLLFSFSHAVTVTEVWCHYQGSAPATPAEFALEDGAGNAMTHTAPVCAAPGSIATRQPVTAGGGLNAGEVLRTDVGNTPSPTSDVYLLCTTVKYQ